MDYQTFFKVDVVNWIEESNRQLEKHTLFAREYWNWVMNSTRQLCDKYDNHPLVMQQVKLLYEYQEEMYREYRQRMTVGEE
ncbi:hypothetical protein [Listeria fleischmannii]|uniref:Uncharacterized protein n=1 Tax=Listeria fleischmannii FSL S10-1203 TaxID=1265822 RepID=W7DSH4_9LIST|nr:hypothetical protein [Listeria fleischmannii]EUJ64835.1 hypothetical protein MCOL2_01530 [Listeria fleischmannii FSL S10-1203]